MRYKIAIIGGGLAGCAAAWCLSRQGHHVTIFEKGTEIASGASGNERGMINPRFYKFFNKEASFYAAGFKAVLKAAEELSQTHSLDFEQCGALHLITDETKKDRYSEMIKNWGWPEEEMRIVSSEKASEIAGTDIPAEALYLATSAQISPKKLCIAYSEQADIRLNTAIESIEPISDGGWYLDGERFDKAILANAYHIPQLMPEVELQTVRGQMALAKATSCSKTMKCNIHYGGYISAPMNGYHGVGASFQPWSKDVDVKKDDNRYILNKLAEFLPHISESIELEQERASLRTTNKHKFPEFGEVKPGLYVSTAHGSHGLVTSLQAAIEIAKFITTSAKA
ncbi:MAG: hypothetical protein CMH28_08975 [Micavibrio sp.]|nr:hypothetical protein [Micavibrio sp.]